MQDYLFELQGQDPSCHSRSSLAGSKEGICIPLDQQVVVVADAAASQEQLMMQARTVLAPEAGLKQSAPACALMYAPP